MRIGTILALILVVASCCHPQIMGVRNRKVFVSAPAATWSYVQTITPVSCSNGTTCSIAGTFTANSVRVISAYAGNNVYLTGCTGGGGTWVTGSTANFALYNATAGMMAAAYNVGGTGGTATITCTYSGSATSPVVGMDEFTKSSGTASLDALSSTTVNSTCAGTCTLAAFSSLTGTSDLLVQIIDWGSGVGNPTAPYVWDSQQLDAYALGSRQTAAPTITQSGGGWQALAFAFK